MEREDLRKVSSSERYALRKQGLGLIHSGKKKGEVAQLLGVNKNTVSNWVKSYKAEGTKGLRDKKTGPKSAKMKLINEAQERAIQKMITDKMPEQLKLNFALWTRKAVKELVEREFGIVIAITTMGEYLRSWGFTPQKPKKRAYEQCPAKVQKWLDEEYPSIKKRALEENAEIHWGDETGVKNQCNHGRSYAPIGQTPVKRSMSKRFSCNMISTVTNQGKVQFMIYSGSMNADRFIEFLKQLLKTTDRKIFLILDNLTVHHCKIVKEWLEKEEVKCKLELFFCLHILRREIPMNI